MNGNCDNRHRCGHNHNGCNGNRCNNCNGSPRGDCGEQRSDCGNQSDQCRQHCDTAGTDCGYYRIDDTGMELARAYIKIQRYENVYDARDALCRGTAFEDLDKPCW